MEGAARGCVGVSARAAVRAGGVARPRRSVTQLGPAACCRFRIGDICSYAFFGLIPTDWLKFLDVSLVEHRHPHVCRAVLTGQVKWNLLRQVGWDRVRVTRPDP